MIDQGLHRLLHDVLDVLHGIADAVRTHGQLRGPPQLRVFDHHRSGGQPVEALLDDAQRLAHLLQPHLVASEAVACVSQGHLEVIGLVAAVRLLLPQVPGHTRGAHHRAGDPEREHVLRGDMPDAHRALAPDGAARQELLVLVDPPGHQLQEGPDAICGAVGQVHRQAAHANVRVVQAQAGDHLEDPQDLLPLAKAVQHHRDGAQLEAGRRQPHQVRGDAVQFHHHHPNDLGSGRSLDPQQSFNGQAICRLVEERGEVVGSSDEGDALLPRAVLGVLLDAGVQVADHRAAAHDVLAVQCQDHPEHPVGRGVLGPHVDDHGLLAEPEILHHSPRRSGGGMNAPLYWVFTPASG